MIRVIGDAPECKRQIVCIYCATRLEYVAGDVKICSSKDYTGCIDITKYINCPICNHRVIVDVF